MIVFMLYAMFHQVCLHSGVGNTRGFPELPNVKGTPSGTLYKSAARAARIAFVC